MFIVTQEGIYTTNIQGLFNDEVEAVMFSVKLWSLEKDHYHDVSVNSIQFSSSTGPVITKPILTIESKAATPLVLKSGTYVRVMRVELCL